MPLAPIVEAFSISHAQILNGTTSFLDALAAPYDQNLDVYGVNSASLEPDTGDYDNEGDDTIQSVWSWINKADVNVQAGYLSFPLIAQLTGQAISSGKVAGKDVLGLDLWHEDSMNVPSKPMLIKMPAKDRDGAPADFIIGLNKVSFKPITFDGPAYKDGLKVNYNGSALSSITNELGVPYPDGKKRFGRILAIARQ